MDIDFNYEEFYNSIVNYFEVTPGPAAKAVINKHLEWWDKCVHIICALLYCIADLNHGPTRKVFGHSKYGASYLAIPHIGTSVAHLLEHCQTHKALAQAAVQ